jgi:hypothetical protein
VICCIVLAFNGHIIYEPVNPEFVKWYHYIATFFAGAFLTNTVPHFIHGISGDPFPTPFSNPPGQGLSSPTVNVLWACFNMLVGYLLLRVSRTSPRNKLSMLVLFLGILGMSIQLSIVFMEKFKA